MDSTLWSRTPLASRPSRYDTGAFATEDLDKGTIVIPKWNESFYDGMEGWVRLDRRQVQQLPRDAKKLFMRYGRFSGPGSLADAEGGLAALEDERDDQVLLVPEVAGELA